MTDRPTPSQVATDLMRAFWERNRTLLLEDLATDVGDVIAAEREDANKRVAKVEREISTAQSRGFMIGRKEGVAVGQEISLTWLREAIYKHTYAGDYPDPDYVDAHDLLAELGINLDGSSNENAIENEVRAIDRRNKLEGLWKELSALTIQMIDERDVDCVKEGLFEIQDMLDTIRAIVYEANR